jgi:hypothetical protein
MTEITVPVTISLVVTDELAVRNAAFKTTAEDPVIRRRLDSPAGNWPRRSVIDSTAPSSLS